MKIIDSIEIQYFRSIKNARISSLNDLNIFSGKNDVGKSNVLKVLDLFFNKNTTNFNEDFNKERLEEVRKESVKGKQIIKIKVTFNNPGNYKALPPRFSVTRTWDRTGKITDSTKDDLERQIKTGKVKTTLKKSKSALTKFLNRIQYLYIPAIKDERFFFWLLELLQQSIFESETKKVSTGNSIQKVTASFNEEIFKLTKLLNQEFESISGISSSLSFPSNLSELFQRLIIDTKSGTHDIPLSLRGEGIRMRYIPTILNFISNRSNKFNIWGVDEPENSCEYSLSKELSTEFSSNYSKRNQLFVATHSFHFISLEGSNINRYRVCKDESKINSLIYNLDDDNKALLQNELGIIHINNELSKVYEQLIEEKKAIDSIKEELKQSKKPSLLFEGPSDNILFSTAYKTIYKHDIDKIYSLGKHIKGDSGATIASGASYLNKFLHDNAGRYGTNNIIIGVFDSDKEGIEQFNALKKNGLYVKHTVPNFENANIARHKDFSNIFAITVVPPSFRSKFYQFDKPQYCYLSTELLLTDNDIPDSNRQYPTLFDQTVWSFTGQKNKFAYTISTKTTVDFSGFLETLTLINKLCGLQ